MNGQIARKTTIRVSRPSEVRQIPQFGQVSLNEVLIDALTVLLVRDPSRFDVIVATNFYGDILSDLASELSGGLGLAGSIMASDTRCCAQANTGRPRT